MCELNAKMKSQLSRRKKKSKYLYNSVQIKFIDHQYVYSFCSPKNADLVPFKSITDHDFPILKTILVVSTKSLDTMNREYVKKRAYIFSIALLNILSTISFIPVRNINIDIV